MSNGVSPVCDRNITTDGQNALKRALQSIQAPLPPTLVQSEYDNLDISADKNNNDTDNNRRADLLKKYCSGMASAPGASSVAGRVWGKIGDWVQGKDNGDIASDLKTIMEQAEDKDGMMQYMLCQQIAQNVAPPKPVGVETSSTISQWFSQQVFPNDYQKAVYWTSLVVGGMFMFVYVLYLYPYLQKLTQRCAGDWLCNPRILFTLVLMFALATFIGMVTAFGIERCAPGTNVWYDNETPCGEAMAWEAGFYSLLVGLIGLVVLIGTVYMLALWFEPIRRLLKGGKLVLIAMFAGMIFGLDMMFYFMTPQLFVLTVIVFRVFSYSVQDHSDWSPPLMSVYFNLIEKYVLKQAGGQGQAGGYKKKRLIKRRKQKGGQNNQEKLDLGEEDEYERIGSGVPNDKQFRVQSWGKEFQAQVPVGTLLTDMWNRIKSLWSSEPKPSNITKSNNSGTASENNSGTSANNSSASSVKSTNTNTNTSSNSSKKNNSGSSNNDGTNNKSKYTSLNSGSTSGNNSNNEGNASSVNNYSNNTALEMSNNSYKSGTTSENNDSNNEGN